MAQDLLSGLIMLSVIMDNTHLEWIIYVNTCTVANVGIGIETRQKSLASIGHCI